MEEMITNISNWLKPYFISWWPYVANHMEFILKIVFGTSFIPIGVNVVRKVISFLERRKARKNLFPYIENKEINEATKFYVSTRGQNVSPTDENEPGNKHAFVATKKLIPFFIKNIFRNKDQENRHFIILADSGMGKSTFLINLYMKYQRLLGQKYSIKLFPLGHPETMNEIQRDDGTIKEKTILLLDAFDEDPMASGNHAARLREIALKTWRYKYIIITCRSQFFSSEQDEPYETNVFKFSMDGKTQYYYRKIYISPFSEKDINRYIRNKFPLYKLWMLRKRLMAYRIIALCPNLMVRPMLLSYIDVLVSKTGHKDFDEIESAGALTSSDIYELLINRWIIREANRLPHERRTTFINNIYIFSENLAVELFQHRRNYGLYIKEKEIFAFAEKHNVDLSELELKGKSLLNRDSSGNFKFAHKSILEFFLAKHAINNENFSRDVFNAANLRGYDQALRFYSELILK